MFTKLSVNINKLATLRNARGHNNPNLIKCALDIEKYGADGITVHPRPDERHIRYSDVYDLKNVLTTEFNIEGNCTETKFVDLVLATNPTQVTLVPDVGGQLTSNHGWDTVTHQKYLQQMITTFSQAGIRTSIFCDANSEMIKAAADTGTDRVELYTESYATAYTNSKCSSAEGEKIKLDFIHTATLAHSLGLGVNAGHDLDLQNLSYFLKNVPYISEVSIGHALICDALYMGLENTVQLYKRTTTL